MIRPTREEVERGLKMWRKQARFWPKDFDDTSFVNPHPQVELREAYLVLLDENGRMKEVVEAAQKLGRLGYRNPGSIQAMLDLNAAVRRYEESSDEQG